MTRFLAVLLFYSFVTPATLLSAASTWLNRDIGAVAAAGSVTTNGVTYTIRGSGADIWGTADEFHFAYQNMTGDFEVVARVGSVQNTDPWAKAGLMIRGTLEPGSPHVLLFLTPQHGIGLQWRTINGGTSSYIGPIAGGPGVWLKLVRIGNDISTYYSSDGANWTYTGAIPLQLPATVFAGLAVTSHRDGVLNTSTFDNVSVSTSGNAVPSAPTNLTATPVSTDRIDLAWTDTSNNERFFALEYSTNGTTFQPLANPTSTTFFHPGLQNNTRYWYRVKAVNDVGDSPWSNVASATTGGTGNAGWAGRDVGAVAAPGSFSQSGNVFTVRGSGADIWLQADEFHFAYQEKSAELELVARVTSIQNTDPWAKAGIMIRDTLETGSPYVAVLATPQNGVLMQYRALNGEVSTYWGPYPGTPPVWLRLVRNDNDFHSFDYSSYWSADGVNWNYITTISVQLPGTVFAGLAVTSHRDGVLNTSMFDNVQLIEGPGEDPPAPPELTATAVAANRIELAWQHDATKVTGYEIHRSTNCPNCEFDVIARVSGSTSNFTDNQVIANTRYTYLVVATNNVGLYQWSNFAEASTDLGELPPPWTSYNVGNASGSARFTNDSFYVQANGSDIYGTSDHFHYVSMPASGGVTIQARVELYQAGSSALSPWARAGVMIRHSLDSNAKNAMAFITAGHGAGLTARTTTGGTTGYTPGPAGNLRGWVRLVRSGDTVTAYWAQWPSNASEEWEPQETDWIPMGSVNLDLSQRIGNSYLVGLAVTSHTGGTVGARFSHVSVVTNPDGGGLPASWGNQDIGAVGVAGSATYNQQGNNLEGIYTVKGSGADIWGTADAFHLAYQTVGQNIEFIARVTAMQNTDPWAKAGIMFRQTLDPNARYAFMMLTPAHGTGFQSRKTPGAATGYAPGPPLTAPVWFKLTMQNDLVTGYTSTDGVNWTVVASDTVPITSTSYAAGLAVTSHNNAALNTATFDNVSIRVLP